MSKKIMRKDIERGFVPENLMKTKPAFGLKKKKGKLIPNVPNLKINVNVP